MTDTLSRVASTSAERVSELRPAQPQCAWCGGATRPIASRLVLCIDCGSATTYPPPDEQELERAYAGWYRPTSGRFSAGGDRVLALLRSTLARRLDRISPPGPVLDVGAGEGALLRALRARGREAVGLERDPRDDSILAADIAEFDERAGEWAAVVFWHSLEHLPNPSIAIDRAAALLAPGGVVVIAVPNLGSWQARALGARWFHLDLPRHLVHLPASALRQGVEERGLRVERLSHWRAGQLMFGWLHGIVGLLPGHPDLYSAIRRPEARGRTIGGGARIALLAAATLLAPVAAALTAAEVAAHAGGTVYLEARRR